MELRDLESAARDHAAVDGNGLLAFSRQTQFFGALFGVEWRSRCSEYGIGFAFRVDVSRRPFEALLRDGRSAQADAQRKDNDRQSGLHSRSSTSDRKQRIYDFHGGCTA
jgi:hypothetical protein